MSHAWLRCSAPRVSGLLVLLGLLLLGHAAQAATAAAKPAVKAAAAPYTFEAMPAWVDEIPAAELQNPPVASAPLQVLLSDDQVRLDEKGGEEHFRRIVRRAQTTAGLEQAAQWELEFDPSYQRLALHRLVVWRGAQRLDRLHGVQFKVLQRETQLERQMYDGRLTISAVLEDIRVGDRVELAFSVRGANPVFAGRFADTDWSVSIRGPLALMRYRLLSPVQRDIRYRADPQRHEITEQVKAGWRDLQVRRREVPMFAWDPDQPPAEVLGDMLQFSEYANWADVGRWAEQLFRGGAAGQDTPELKAQSQALVGDTPAASVAKVLDFVQNDVRYFGTEIGANTHQPASPAVVLRQRFGDCKDKVALMTALLRLQGIDATPLLVSTLHRGGALDLLPGPLAFNHAIIRVALDKQPLVLDPTRSQQRGPLAERETVGMGRALPAVADAVALTLPTAAGVLRMDIQDTLSFRSLAEDPELESVWTYHGEYADWARAFFSGERIEEARKQQNSDYARQYPGAEPVGELVLEEVPDHDALRLRMRFHLPKYLRLVEDKQLVGELGMVGLYSTLRLPDQAPRTKGLRLAALGSYRQQVTVLYPEDVFTQPQQQQRDDGDRFTALHTSQQLTARRAELRAELLVREQDVPAGEWAAHRDALNKLWPRLGNSLSIGVLSPAAVEQLKPQLARYEDELKRGKVKPRTSEQVSAAVKLMVLDKALAGDRLPPTARGQLLMRRAIQLDNLDHALEAERSLTQALALLPDDPEVLAAAAVNASQRRDDAQAIALADRGLAQQPGDVHLHMLRARALYETGRFEEARGDVLEALKQAMGDQATYARLWLALLTKRLGGDVNAALKSQPGSPATTWPQPILETLLGQRTEAEARSAAAKPSDQALGQQCELAYFLGEWQLLDGQREAARRLFQQSVDTGVTEFTEFQLARRQLDRLKAGG